MSASCCFCTELSGRSGDFASIYPEITKGRFVHQTPGFVVFPSLGQLSPGHLLIVPRLHVKSFAALPTALRDEAVQVFAWAVSAVERQFSAPVCFEHGSAEAAESGGCGIVHAHLHVVPAGGTNLALPPSIGRGWRRLSGAPALPPSLLAMAAEGYFWWRDPKGAAFAEPVQHAPSQFLRRHVAMLLGADTWDWRIGQRQQSVPDTLAEFNEFDSLQPGAITV